MGLGVLPGCLVLSSSLWSPLSPQEALLVALKSLPSGTLLNVAGFGTDVKPLFPSSRLCSNVSAARHSAPPPLSVPPPAAPQHGRGAGDPGNHCEATLCASRRRCAEPVSTSGGCRWTRVAPTCWWPWAGRWRSPCTTAIPASSSSSLTRQRATRAGSSGCCAGRPALSGMAPGP